MFDKYRSLTQSSAFKRQHRPSANTAHLSQPKPIYNGSLPTKTGSNCTCRRAICLRQLLGIVEVL